MGLKYFSQYRDFFGDTREIRFYKEDFSGAPIEWVTEKGAVRFTRGNSDGFFPDQPIIASQAQISLILKERYDLTEFVSNRKTFYVEIADTTLNRIIWSGWLEPWDARHAYSRPPYVVGLTASCGLAHLSRKKYENPNTIFKKTGLQIIQDCLAIIGRDDMPIRISTHMYENGFTGDSRLGLTSFEENTFRYYDENGEALYCDVIVNNILNHFNAEITQWNNMWVIRAIVDNSTGFDASYTDIGESPHPLAWPSTFSVNDDVTKSLDGGQIRILPPINKYRTEIDFGTQKPFFENGNMLLWNENGLIGWDFTHMAKGNPGWEQFGLGGQSNRSVLKINGKSPQPYRKKKKKKFWQVAVPILTGMVGANLKNEYQYVEPAEYIESPGGSISVADKSVTITFDYETEAFSSDILISIRIPSTVNGKTVNFWVDPSSHPALAGADKTTASATEAFRLIRIPPVDMGKLTDKGTIDASSNPNYPAANWVPGSKNTDWTWTVTGVPAGEYRRIGGAVTGVLVENGDLIVARVANGGGTQEAVGSFWEVISIRNNTKKGTYSLTVSLSTTFIIKPGQDFPADKIYVRFYKMADDSGKPGDWYKVYNLNGALSGFVASEESAKYATTLERGDVTDEEADTISLISGDFTPWYVGAWTKPGSNDVTSSWRRRPPLNESYSVYRAMMKDRLCMTTRPLSVFEGKIAIISGDSYLHYLHRLYFVDQDKSYRIVRFSYDDSRKEADVTAVEIKYEEIPDAELKQDSYIPGSRQLNTVPGQGDGIYPSKQDSTSGRLNAEDMPLTEDELAELVDANSRIGNIFDGIAPLVFTVGEQATKYLDLTQYFSEAYLYNTQTDDDEEVFDPTNLLFKVIAKPTWVSSAIEDDLIIGVTGKPTAIGPFTVSFIVTDPTEEEAAEEIIDEEGNVVPTVPFSMQVDIPIIVYPKTTIKYTLRDTSGTEPLGVGEITNGSGFLKPDTWDILVQVKGHHEGWYGKLTGMGIDVQPSPDPYALTPSTDEATYIIGYNIDSEVGIYNLIFATYRDEGEPDNLKLVKRDKIRFTLYDEEYINKASFELWGAESGTLIGPINPNGSSAFNVEEAWDVKMIVDGVEHDAGTSVLGSEAGDLDTLTIGPLDPAVIDASYFQFGEVRNEFTPDTYNVLLTLNLEGAEQYVRAASFTINKEKVKPVGGRLQLVSMVPNTTNYDVMGVLAINGNLFTLPTNGWNVLLESEVRAGTTRKHQLLQKKGSSLVNINTSVYTGVSEVKEYLLAIDEDQYFIFDDLSSKDIGKIHVTPSSFRVIITDEVDGEVTNIYQADFSFGTLEDLDDLEISEPGNSGDGTQEYYAGRGLSEIVDDYIKTFNVNTDNVTLEIYDQTNITHNWLRVKDKGITFAKIQDITGLSLIGKLTAGSGSPYEVPVITSTTLAGASDLNIVTSLAIKTYVDNKFTSTVTGLANRIAKFATNTTLTYSILEESGIALIARDGIFVSDTASNTNIRGFSVQESGVNRFSFGKLGTAANFAFWRFNDAGNTVLGTPLQIERSTGKITLETQLTIQGSSLAPLVVSSNILVTNFNADLLDGQHGPYYLDRANHTGTQLASTISNFSPAVLATTLTGLSTSNSSITSSDTILQAFGKIQGQITGNISGTTGRIAKFTGPNAIGASILEESGISLIARQGIFVADNTSNTNVRGFVVQEGGQNRFSFGKQGTGADFAFWRYADDGVAVLGTPISIERSTGKVTLETQLTIQGSSLAPLVVSSSVLVTNFNADLLDGQHGPYYLDWNNFTNVKSVLAGNGMTGGGSLTGNVTITLGTPATLTNITTNDVSGSTHSHAIATSSLSNGTGIILSASGANVILGNNNISIGLASSGVSAGTYNSVTVDVYGRVTSASNVSSGISGTAGYIAQFGSGGTTVVNSVIRDTGTEINVADTRSFGVEGPAAMRDYLHVWGYQSNGTASNHGSIVVHNESSATAHASAAIEIRSTTKGLLLPRMTSTQRAAISDTAGLMVWQTDSAVSGAGVYVSYGSGAWIRLMPDL